MKNKTATEKIAVEDMNTRDGAEPVEEGKSRAEELSGSKNALVKDNAQDQLDREVESKALIKAILDKQESSR